MYYLLKVGEVEVERVSPAAIVARIDRLAGRSIGAYIVTRAIPDAKRRYGRERAFVAVSASRVQPPTPVYARGFTVEVVR